MTYENCTLGSLLSVPEISRIAKDAIRNRDLSQEDLWNKTLKQLREEHIFSGNIMQLALTTVIGALFCFFRLKIKNCTTLSLIICHGVYDAMISVWASTLL